MSGTDLTIFKTAYKATRDLREAAVHIPPMERLVFLARADVVAAIREIDAEPAGKPALVEKLEKDYHAVVNTLVTSATANKDVKAAREALAAIQWQLSKADPEKYGGSKKDTPSVAVQVNTGPVTLRTPEGELKEVVFNVGD